MSAYKWVELVCDRDCGATYREREPSGNISVARAEAAEAGWKHRGKQDFCPRETVGRPPPPPRG